MTASDLRLLFMEFLYLQSPPHNSDGQTQELLVIVHSLLSGPTSTFHWHVPLCCLSPGSRRLLALYLTLQADPKVLLLEDPCEGLDPATADEVRRRLIDVSYGKTGILVAQ